MTDHTTTHAYAPGAYAHARVCLRRHMMLSLRQCPPGRAIRQFTRAMAGHSKYHNIRHRKAKQDAAKDKVQTRYLTLIKTAMKEGNEAKVERAVKDAKKNGIRGEVLERALKRGRDRQSGKLNDVLYEGNLSGGVLVIVEGLTDNPKRTAPEVRSVLTKAGGSLGAAGAASWAFSRRGLLEYAAPVDDAAREALIEAAMEAGAEDIEDGEDGEEGMKAGVEVWTASTDFTSVRDAIAAACSLMPESEQLVYDVTGEHVRLGEEEYEAAAAALQQLESLEDVEHVYHNMRPA